MVMLLGVLLQVVGKQGLARPGADTAHRIQLGARPPRAHAGNPVTNVLRSGTFGSPTQQQQ
eukprot:7092705-Pyramimonas_sp.AAC.1